MQRIDVRGLGKRHPRHKRSARANAFSPTSRASRCNSRLRIEARSSEREMTSADAGAASDRGSRVVSREARLAIPHALLLCGLDVLPDARAGVEFDHAFVEIIGNAGLREQGLRGGRSAQ